MKLIRLESDTELTQSQFTNFLASPLVLEKNSKVALKTLVAQFEEPPYIVDSSNDTFSYRTSDDYTIHQVIMKHGSYSSVDEFCDMVQDRMNCLLDGTGSGQNTDNTDFGFMWEVSSKQELGENFIQFDFNRSVYLTLDDTNTANLNMIFNATTGFNKDPAVPNGADANDANAILKAKPLVCNGGFSVSCILGKQNSTQTEDISASDWYLTIEPFKTLVGNQSIGDVVDRSYAVLGCFQGLYFIKRAGTMTMFSDGISPGEDDTIEIRNNNGVIEYRVDFDLDNGDSLVNDYNDSGSQVLMTCLYIPIDDGKIAFSEIEITPNPFDASDINGNYFKLNPDDMVKHRLRADAEASNVTIFLELGSKRLLGFDNNQVSINAVSGTFNPINALKSNVFDNDLIVEIPELALDGYDHSNKSRVSLITVLTSGDVNKSTGTGSEEWELSFHEPFPVFLDLNNKIGNLIIPSLTVRISTGGILLPLAGKMSCSLLFDTRGD
jgi:hypothetical protein